VFDKPLDRSNNSGLAPLHQAVLVNELDCVGLLLKYGADPEVRDATASGTPLHYAAKRGYISIAAALVDACGSIHVRDRNGVTPVMVAAENGRERMVRYLVSAGARTQETSFTDKTLLCKAVEGGNSRLVGYLISEGCRAKVDQTRKLNSYSPAFDAVLQQRHLRTLAFNHGAFANSFSWDLVHPSLFERNSTKGLKMVLRASARLQEGTKAIPTGSSWYTATPIAFSIAAQNVEALRLLVNAGVSVDDECCDDGSPLMLACRNGYYAAVEYLLRSGARVAYVKEDIVFNAIEASNHYPDLQLYLLVGRYTDQRKLCQRTNWPADACESQKPWSGFQTIVTPQTGRYGRFGNESAFEFAKRLVEIKRYLEGKVLGFHEGSFFVLEE
jgi:ankyrin repeat protein